MSNPKSWEYKNWIINKDCSGDFWIGLKGSRTSLLRKAKTLAAAKVEVNRRISGAKAFSDVLTQNNVTTIKDLDGLKKKGESRFDVLARIFGAKMAHELLHVLSLKSA